MGSAVEALAVEQGDEIVARFDADRPLTEAAGSGALNDADAVIDFSLPDLALDHLRRYCAWDATAVVGTTGWYERVGSVEEWVDESHAAILYAPNFSLGVALLRQAVEAVAPLVDELPEYDPHVHEVHHTRKADSPSGTALMLAQVLLDGIGRKDHVEPEAQHGPIDAAALHVSSTRAGTVFGTHTVGFDSPFDSIELIHRAKNRKGFASGALRAARWLQGRRGLFTLDDLLADWLG